MIGEVLIFTTSESQQSHHTCHSYTSSFLSRTLHLCILISRNARSRSNTVGYCCLAPDQLRRCCRTVAMEETPILGSDLSWKSPQSCSSLGRVLGRVAALLADNLWPWNDSRVNHNFRFCSWQFSPRIHRFDTSIVCGLIGKIQIGCLQLDLGRLLAPQFFERWWTVPLCLAWVVVKGYWQQAFDHLQLFPGLEQEQFAGLFALLKGR